MLILLQTDFSLNDWSSNKEDFQNCTQISRCWEFSYWSQIHWHFHRYTGGRIRWLSKLSLIWLETYTASGFDHFGSDVQSLCLVWHWCFSYNLMLAITFCLICLGFVLHKTDISLRKKGMLTALDKLNFSIRYYSWYKQGVSELLSMSHIFH